MRTLCCLALLALLITLTGCIELTRQRLAWRYDAGADRLDAVLFYDGIHDSEPDKVEAGKRKLAEFIEQDGVMLMDWVLDFRLAPMRAELDETRKADGQLSAADAALAGLLQRIDTAPIGHYVEPGGRIGAAQLIRIREASKALEHFNQRINALVAEGKFAPGEPMQALAERWREAAKRGHAWLTLEGQALVINLPMHPDAWRAAKAEMLGKLLDQDADDRDTRNVARFLANNAVSLEDRGGMLHIQLGLKDKPNLLRLPVRPDYTDNVRDAVKRHVPADLTAQLAAALAGEDVKSPGIDAIAVFGPPEMKALSYLKAGEFERLRRWARQWNATHPLRRIEGLEGDDEALRQAVETWYIDQFRYDAPDQPQHQK